MDNPELLNTSLELALEWGENWLKPIQSRLAKHYPHLSAQELDDYNHIAQKTMHYGWAIVEEIGPYSRERFEAQLLKNYPWVNNENLSRLFSQGCYYAMK